MVFHELTFILLAASICCSQNDGNRKTRNDPADGKDYWNKYTLSSNREYLFNKEDIKLEPNKKEIFDAESTKPEKDTQSQQFNGCGKNKNAELIYPSKNATFEVQDLLLGKGCQTDISTGCPNKSSFSQNVAEKENHAVNRDEINRLLGRDTDSFYDNELVNNVLSSDEILSNQLQIKTVNNDPILLYKGNHGKEINRNNREKKEVTSSADYDYDYDEKPAEETNAAKRSFSDFKQKISKIMKPKENRQLTTVSRLKTDSSKLVVPKDLMKSEELAYSSLPPEKEITTSAVEVQTYNESVSDENVTLSDLNDSANVEENSNVKSIPKRKDSCRLGKDEAAANCLPQGGVPKNPSVQFLGTNRDSEYEKLIKGDIPEKLLKTVLQKVNRNSDMGSQLGICDFDTKEIKDLYNSVRNKQNECCMKLKGEFKCFLNWLLTVDASRKKRSSLTGRIETEKGPTIKKMYGEKNSCPIYIGGAHIPSPQYQKLFEKVQQYKEENSEPGSFSQDAYGVPESSINF